MLKYWLTKWSSLLKTEGNFSFKVASITGFKPKNEQLYRLAFTHSSVSVETKGKKLNNERLEFLGDAVLGSVVSEYLYQKYPHKGEGFLTSMRSKIVSRQHLNKLALNLKLNELLEYNTTGSTTPKSINGDAFEALIGALFLDRGYRCCQRFVVHTILQNHVNLELLSKQVNSYKSLMLEWAAKNKQKLFFKMVSEKGQSHAKHFVIALWYNQEQVATGSGPSKKKAEEQAARDAYNILALNHGPV